MRLLKKSLYCVTKIIYYIMVLIYVLIPSSIVFFDVIDFNGEYREIICFPTIIIFIPLYIITVELSAIIFKVPVERYEMFSKKYKKTIATVLLNIIFILFAFESILITIIAKRITYYDALIILSLLFFRIAIRMSTIELKSIKEAIRGRLSD
ncbi:hypothetical protein [uncultured Eubacterium sp.]|uniref:hypothetical protein n=1 Tax=uncultured Eubacterium sp. TaxID=165185 RepID=UPI0025FB8835|nr:hypothetical protein [uncultured Eubacterium sp.]